MTLFSLDRELRRFRTSLKPVRAWGSSPEACRASSSEVSAWSVRQHLEHLYRTDRMTVDWLEGIAAGEEEDPKGDGAGPTVIGWIVLLLGRIPRGKGRALDGTRPADMTCQEVAGGFEELGEALRALDGETEILESSRSHRRHPVFGSLSVAQWLRFTRIHHDHHHAIIHDILAADPDDGN